jgi:hypothetical protein
MAGGNMDKTPDFLKSEVDENELQQDSLTKLSNLINYMKIIANEVVTLESELKYKIGVYNKINQEEIPQLMLSHNLSRIKLASGEEVNVKEDFSVSIDNDDAFHNFLQKRNEDDIVKLQVSFSKMPTEKIKKLLNFLEEDEYDYDLKYSVHSQTRKKYFKDLLGLDKYDYEEGLESGRYIRREELPEWVKLFFYHVTKVK